MVDFLDAVVPDDASDLDTTPLTSDIEYPCRVCGKESGPYSGRGRHPTKCAEHRKTPVARATPRVTGSAASLAAQATAVLVQINGLMAAVAMGLQMFGTAGAIGQANSGFEQMAHQALLTDPELCKLILKGGVKSAKLSLGLAYVSMGAVVGPVAVAEIREKKAARDAAREVADDENGT